MERKHVGLIVVVLLLAVGYLWMFNARRVPPVEGRFMQLPGSAPTFAFNDKLVFREIKVVQATPDPGHEAAYQGAGEDRVVWHLVEREPPEGQTDEEADAWMQRREVRAVSYGRGVRGLRRAAGVPRRGVPLEPGAEYVFYGTLAEGYGDGVVEVRFTPKKPTS
jgi:hypothetical protein